jgi:hypothetical protein
MLQAARTPRILRMGLSLVRLLDGARVRSRIDSTGRLRPSERCDHKVTSSQPEDEASVKVNLLDYGVVDTFRLVGETVDRRRCGASAKLRHLGAHRDSIVGS